MIHNKQSQSNNDNITIGDETVNWYIFIQNQKCGYKHMILTERHFYNLYAETLA